MPLTGLTYEAIRFRQRERFASVEDPYTVFLPKPCAVTKWPQRNAFALRFERKRVPGSKAQIVANLFRNNDATGFVDRNGGINCLPF